MMIKRKVNAMLTALVVRNLKACANEAVFEMRRAGW